MNTAAHLMLALAVASCSVATGTRAALDQSKLLTIKNVGVQVKQEEAFSVRVARERMSNIGGTFFGLLGLAVEAGVRSASDGKLEEGFKAAAGQYDLVRALSEELVRQMTARNAFRAVERIGSEDVSALRARGYDAIFELTVKQWGLRVCAIGGAADDVQVGLGVVGRMILVADGSVAWEREELYLDGECYPVEKFRSTEELLAEALARAGANVAGKVANELLFP